MERSRQREGNVQMSSKTPPQYAFSHSNSTSFRLSPYLLPPWIYGLQWAIVDIVDKREQAYWMIKSTILCFNMVSECVFVIKNEISYPYPMNTSVAVDRSHSTVIIRTGTGFLRSTMKLSARCIMNRVNLWHRIRSISSACLILILMRIELTEGSMRTRSFSLREIVNGLSRTSLEPLDRSGELGW